ncbi:hypothetical protein GGR58DRAFT_458716, partial [Xylaria digitata]
MNLRSRQTVSFVRQYQMVVSHGLNLLRTLMRVRLAIEVSLLDIKACTIMVNSANLYIPL